MAHLIPMTEQDYPHFLAWAVADYTQGQVKAGAWQQEDALERAEWLKLMRSRAEALYDRFSYRYWDTWGTDVSDVHREYIQKFLELFDGVICMDAMEHICPEDCPGILHSFEVALKPGGVLYFTADREEEPDFDLKAYYELGKASGLPIVFGEVADEAAFKQAMEQTDVSDELTDRAVYHYYPPLAKVREWINQAGLMIEEEGAGSGFHHFVVRKK
jgi:hypothetical protein